MKYKKLIKTLGPGFIIASVVMGPGSIAVGSRAGSENGYTLLWVIAMAAICMMIYTSMAVRFGLTNEATILQTINKKCGRWFSWTIGFSSFGAAACFQFGNNLGIGIGMEGITSVDERIWPIVFTTLAFILLFWAKNLYKVLEKLMMAMVMVMILAFLVNLALAEPNLAEAAKGLLPTSFKMVNIDMIAALVATTFAINGALYQSYLVKDKGLKPKDLERGVTESNMGVFFLALISMLIIITSAAALYPKGISVKSAADMAIQLESLFGNYAKFIFSLGLCAAAFSSLMVNAVIGGGLLADSLGMGSSMNQKTPKIFTSVILLVGMLVAVFFRGDAIYALILAQSSTIIALPFIAIGMNIVLNDRNIMGKNKNSLGQNLISFFGLLLALFIVYSMLKRVFDAMNIIGN